MNDLWLLAAIPRSATPSEDMVQHVEHNLGPREVLVNNAGTIIVGAVENQSVETFEDAVNTNFWGPLYATLSVMDGMKRRKHGRVVNIASLGGKIAVPHLLPHFCEQIRIGGFKHRPQGGVRKGWNSCDDRVPGLNAHRESQEREIYRPTR